MRAAPSLAAISIQVPAMPIRVSTVILLLGLTASSVAASAQDSTVRAPAFSNGDSWVFEQTIQKGPAGFQQMRLDMRIERLDGATMIVSVKPDGAPTAPTEQVVGQDWSKRHLEDGEQTTTTRPLSFPLRTGKSWSIDYQDTARRGNQLSDHVRRTYTVMGWEDVTVPAGTFHALKVEAKGVDDAVLEVPERSPGRKCGGRAVQQAVSAGWQRGGRGHLVRSTYAALYYVPALRNFVQSVEEQYNGDDVRVGSTTLKLVSWKAGGG